MEGPFYGYRRPKSQSYFRLSHVSDLPCLGFATIEESCSLIRWLNDNGYGPIALGGNSMGGLHSAMVSAVSPYPVGCSSWLGPPSAVPVFTRVYILLLYYCCCSYSLFLFYLFLYLFRVF